MNYEEQVKGWSNKELLQAHANAMNTHMSCGGHNKARMNEDAARMCANELKRRGLPVDEQAWRKGTFNGKGAV